MKINSWHSKKYSYRRFLLAGAWLALPFCSHPIKSCSIRRIWLPGAGSDLREWLKARENKKKENEKKAKLNFQLASRHEKNSLLVAGQKKKQRKTPNLRYSKQSRDFLFMKILELRIEDFWRSYVIKVKIFRHLFLFIWFWHKRFCVLKRFLFEQKN